MTDHESIEATRTAWQSQPAELPAVSIDYLRHRSRDRADEGRTRQTTEYLIGAMALALCAWFGTATGSGLLRAGVIVMAAGILYSLYESWSQKGRWVLTLDGSAVDGLQFYRQELERVRDLHRRRWRVYLPASLPGAATLLAWVFRESDAVGGGGATIILALAVTIWVVAMLRYEAHEASRCQSELDALSR